MLKPIQIKEGAFIGLNSIILPGTIIGEGTIVGSGSVVKGNIPDGVVVVGNPAKIMETTDEYYEKLKKNQMNNIHFK